MAPPVSTVGASTSEYGAYDPSSSDKEAVKAWEQAKDEAEEAGIRWERPKGDTRTAQEIIDDTPLLKNLGNQEGVREMLEDRVGGDIETDADAAYRAAQVLEHIEKLDENGNRIASGDIDDGRVNGFTKGGDAKHGTEAGRLKDFGENGFSFLQGELRDVSSAGDDAQARKEAEALGIAWERPEGDDRSAQDIIDDTPLLKNLGDQSDVRDMLKDRVGDFETDADAAYRAAQVLDHIENFDEDGNRIAGRDVNNGRVDGFTKGGDAKHGEEAGRLQDFGKYGFSHLKGKMSNPDLVGNDRQAREEAEKAGIKWELPEDDDRSAQDIIDQSPLLKNLGNQSGVKDMLKERVGDFEKDADAAYRASQVLDRIAMYDENGEMQLGDGVANTSVDGFTKSGEAKHGTEAGRLQDFGKYGFESLGEPQKAEDIAAYKDFLDANPDADPTSQTFAKYAAVLAENFDAIRGKMESGEYVSAEDLKTYMKENPQISDDLKEALNFWSQPGAFDVLETAQDPLKLQPDGKLGKKDINSWLANQAPTDATSAITFLSATADASAVSGTDTSELDKDLFEHPENHSTEEKAAALKELLEARELIGMGIEAGMWGDDYSKVSISNRVRSHPDPEKLLADLNDHIDILQSDPAVVEHLNTESASRMSDLLSENKGLEEALRSTYDDEIKSGKKLDALWDKNTKDGATDQQAALAEFFSSASMFQSALGIEDVSEIQDAVKNSEHNKDFQDFYEKSLVSGDRFNELLKDNTFEEAISAYSAEVSLYNAALDPEFTEGFDKTLNENYSKIVQENAFKDATFDDMKAAFGVDGGEELDEGKVKEMIETIIKDNPEYVTNADGTVATADQILASFRGDWDLLRQGSKTVNELGLFNPNSSTKDAYGKGVMHGVSGLFLAGVTIAKGAGSGGTLTDRQIVDITTGSVQTATIMAEGGMKGAQDYLKNASGMIDDELLDGMTDVLKKFENAAKGLGGIAGIAMGAYGIFDGVQSIRKGDTLGGGMSITAGSLGAMAGLASGVEGALGVVAPTLLRTIPVGLVAGGLGMAAAGVGALALMIPGLVEEGKQQVKSDNFGSLLSSYLTKYEIDGVKNGDYWDIPDEDWPETSEGLS